MIALRQCVNPKGLLRLRPTQLTKVFGIAQAADTLPLN
jgi:hypothetical protein